MQRRKLNSFRDFSKEPYTMQKLFPFFLTVLHV